MTTRFWLAALLLAGVGELWVAHGWLRAPYITNDGYQYLDAASSVASGGCLCTRVAHFDEQVAAGKFPVPLTHFPPGYPLLIAGLSRFGMTLETAGYLLSATGFLVCVWLIWDIGCMLGASPLMISIAALLWMTHRDVLTYASAVLTESIFTVAILAMAALIVRDLRTNGKQPFLLVAIGGVAGAAYSLRYAGLFLIPPALLYMFWRSRRNPEALPWALAAVFAICCFILPIQIRNVVYMGSWRGAYASSVPQSLSYAVLLGIVAFFRVIAGGSVSVPLSLWIGLLLLSIVSVFFPVFRAWQRGAYARPGEFFPLAISWLGLFVFAYIAGIVFAKVSMANMNMISADMVRYYLPVYPLLLVGLAGAISRTRSKGLRLATASVALAMLMAHSLDFFLQAGVPGHVVIAADLSEELYAGESLRHWLLDRVSPEEVIVAEEGQALHFVLPLPVVSIVEPPEFSNLPVDGTAFQSLMSRYRARYLLLFPVIRVSGNSLPFLHGLTLGRMPRWLKLRAQTRDVAVYECETCAR